MNILVVEADRAIAQSLQVLLQPCHCAIALAPDGAAALRMAIATDYQLVLLDSSAPQVNGLEVCRQLRQQGFQSPIVVLLGPEEMPPPPLQGHTTDQQKAGANDYIVKPFDPDELVARIQTWLQPAAGEPSLNWGPLSLDPATRRVWYQEQSLTLTPKEWAILELLVGEQDRIFSATVILERVWQAAAVPGTEAVRGRINDLRQKLTAAGAPKDLIQTVRRVGYRLNPLYATSTPVQADQTLPPSQVAELRAVGDAAPQAELQQRNQELQTARDELEHQVADRTAELNVANQALQQRESLLNKIYNGAEQAIFVIEVTDSRDFRYLAFNHVAERYAGISQQDIQGKTPEAAFGMVTGAAFRHNYQQCLQEDRSITYEEYVVLKGCSIWTLTTLSPVRDAEGTIEQIIGTSVDISDRKQAEATIEADLRDTQLLHDLSTRLTVETDIQVLYDEIVTTAIALLQADAGTIQILDPATQDLLLLASQGMDQPMINRFYRVKASSNTSCGIALATGDRTFLDFDGPDQADPDGSLRIHVEAGYRSAQSTPLITRSGQAIGMVSTHWRHHHRPSDRELRFLDLLARQAADLIEHRQTQLALHHNQAMFSALVENAPFGIYVIDAEFRLQQINQGAKAVFSNIDPLLGRDFAEILRILWQEPFATEAINHFRHTLASGESYYSPVIVERRANITEIQAYDWQIHRITLPTGGYGVVCYFYDLSAIKRTEAALYENEQLLRLAITGTQAGTWDWVLATGQITGSPETYQLYGLDPATPLAEYNNWYESYVHPDDRPQIGNALAQMIAQRQSDIQLEFRILHPQQGIRWILSLGHLTLDDQGEPVRLSGINLDISDRKHAELTLRKQIQQEYLLNEIAQDIRRSLNLNQVLASTVHRVRAFLEVDRVVIFRFRPDWQGDVIMESVGPEWTPILSTTIYDPCFHDHCIEPYRQGRVATLSDIATADLEPCYVELLQQFQVKANLVVPILQNDHLWGLLIAHHCAAPRLWQPAEIAMVKRLATQVGIAIQQSELYQQLQLELDDRKQAEQKIREQAALLDISTDAILVCDLDYRILYWNQGAEQLYGWQAEEVLGQQANELLSRNPSTFLDLKRVVLEQGTWHGEIQKFTKTGQKVTVEGRCTLVRDETGQPKSILSVDTDITEKKSLEAQFYQAQRLESLGTLTSGIAHDLNNALTPILTIAQLLRMQKTKLDEQSYKMLQLVEDSAKRATAMVRQILTFTRGSGGERTAVNVAALLQEVINVVQQTFPKLIALQVRVPAAGVSAVAADATQLHQVLINLCVNARDAMPNGGTLTLAVEDFAVNEIFAQMNLDAQVGPYVLITVSDTGTGIAADVRDRIFDPFFTTKALGQGTGLGLSTVLGIVRSYGGFVQVVSDVGQGTQFKVYLPAIEANAAPKRQATPLPQGQGELILVIDDEDRILQSTRAMLEAYHYQVLTARSGVEAIATYVQHQAAIAIVLVDMMLPDMDGIAIIQILQEMNPHVRAIAVTGLLPQYQSSLEALGIKVHLHKPYTTEHLLTSIHRQLAADS